MSKTNIKDLMNERSPLSPSRQVVEPANLYATPQDDKTTSPQTDSPTSPQKEEATSGEVGKSTKPQVDNAMKSESVVKATKPQPDKATSPLNHMTTKPLVGKYTTHLRLETIKNIKRIALESDRKDYEVVQEAIDKFFKETGAI